MSVSRDYMIEKLMEWKPLWVEETINSWKPDQLEQIYRQVQQSVVNEINNSILDFRTK